MEYDGHELDVIEKLLELKTKLETPETNEEKVDIINTITILLKEHDIRPNIIIKTIKKWMCYCTKTNDDNKCHKSLFEKIISAMYISLMGLNSSKEDTVLDSEKKKSLTENLKFKLRAIFKKRPKQKSQKKPWSTIDFYDSNDDSDDDSDDVSDIKIKHHDTINKKPSPLKKENRSNRLKAKIEKIKKAESKKYIKMSILRF